jgi:uncharacterized protein with HEPN domain
MSPRDLVYVGHMVDEDIVWQVVTDDLPRLLPVFTW